MNLKEYWNCHRLF